MSAEQDGPNVDAYLNQVCWAMDGSFAEQQAVRDELRAHLREAARDLVMSGMLAADALVHALNELGNATDLGRAMRTSRGTRPLRRPLVQPAGAVLLHSEHTRNLPGARLAVALAALVATPAAVALTFVWPG